MTTTMLAPSPAALIAALAVRIDRHAADVQRFNAAVKVAAGYSTDEPGNLADTVIFSDTPTPVEIPWPPARTIPLDTTTADYPLEVRRYITLGRAVTGVAHDFNNLLAVIQGFAELLVEQTEPESPQREAAATIAATTDVAAGVARHLLSVARPEASTIPRCDLGSLFQRLGRVLKAVAGARVKLMMTPGDDVPPVAIDPPEVTQILLNLATNAHDAMPDGGILTIRSEVVGNCVRLSVIDTGVGMDPATRDQMFDQFYTTKANGRGIGLATVAEIVARAGGAIVVDSAPGLGTTVMIDLPRGYAVRSTASVGRHE